MKKIMTICMINMVVSSVQAQMDSLWKGRQCAVVLTYDDGLNVHVNKAIPALDSVGLKGTFYISDYFNGLSSQIPKWKKAAARGHELANHTIWHPCEGGRPDREFVSREYDLRSYSVRRMTDEIRGMNNFLAALDGKSKRTFAFPCGDTRVNDTNYIDLLKNDFVAARVVRSEMPTKDKVKLYDIGCYMINGESGDQLIALVEEASKKHALLVFLFHGVGGEHGLNVSAQAHSKLLHYLEKNKQRIWTATMVEVAEYIKKTRGD